MRIRPSAARLDVVAGAEAGNTGLPLRLRGLENRTVGERRDGRRGTARISLLPMTRVRNAST
jgi:hypothetical protein